MEQDKRSDGNQTVETAGPVALNKIIKVPNFQSERKFSAWFTKLLRKEFGEHICVVNITGTAYGNNGVSDLIICFYGIYFAVELKLNNKKLTKLQLRFSMQIDRAGGRTLSPVTPNKALDALEYFRTIEQYRGGREVIQSLAPDEAQEVVNAAKAEIAKEDGRCAWHQEDEEGDAWSASCGSGFNLNDGIMPSECGFEHCPFCGDPIAEVPWVPEVEEEAGD